jgi:hydroxymethylglutaryl-CoA reductase
MGLHARSVALAAGATGETVDRVAALIFEARDITVEGARRAMRVLQPEVLAGASSATDLR